MEFRQAKDEAANLKRKAEETAPFTPKLGELFATLPNTLEQLDEAIADARARADVSYSTNPKVIEEYEARCKEVPIHLCPPPLPSFLYADVSIRSKFWNRNCIANRTS